MDITGSHVTTGMYIAHGKLADNKMNLDTHLIL